MDPITIGLVLAGGLVGAVGSIGAGYAGLFQISDPAARQELRTHMDQFGFGSLHDAIP